MNSSTVTSKGQTTIPASIRKRLELKPGSRIDFLVRENGDVVIRPAQLDMRQLAGTLKRSGRRAVSIAAMNLAIKSAAKRKK